MFLIMVVSIVIIAVTLWLIAERRRPLRQSTPRLIRRYGIRRSLSLNAIHAYIYGRWTNQYIAVLLHWIFPRISRERRQWWSDHYHGKVITHDEARAIISIDKKISLRDLEQIIPYPTARDIVLKGPPDIVVFECACRHSRKNPCQPTRVCMIVGQPFANFILQHKPGTSRRLTQAEALELLRAEYERGHMHSAWFKDVLLNRFYAICNCCKCCCGGVEAMTKYGTPMMASSGFVARLDEELCTNCDICVNACPFGALSPGDIPTVNWEKCMGCGVCVGQCALGAMTLLRDERKGYPLDVRLLAREQSAN